MQELKPFDKMLVRNGNDDRWKIDLFGFMEEDGTMRGTAGCRWLQCVPYEGNETLLGTTDEPNYGFKFGDKVEGYNGLCNKWCKAIYIKYSDVIEAHLCLNESNTISYTKVRHANW